jgi:hypothetical protein
MTVLDITLLISTAGVGMGLIQLIRRGIFEHWIWTLERGLPDVQNLSTWDVIVTCTDLTTVLIPLLASWTLLLMILRLISPRPSWRRIWQQPGMAACLAALFGWLWSGVALVLALDVTQVAQPQRIHTLVEWAQKFFADEVFMYVGLAVAAAWFVQLVGGRWRKPADWIDRLGRVVGVLWIVTGLVWARREYLEIV